MGGCVPVFQVTDSGWWWGGWGGGSNLSVDSGVDICVLIFQMTGSDCCEQVLVPGVFQVIGIGLIGTTGADMSKSATSFLPYS